MDVTGDAAGSHHARALVVQTAGGGVLPQWVGDALRRLELRPHVLRGSGSVMDAVRRAPPALLVVTSVADVGADVGVRRLLNALKADAYTALVPCVVLHHDDDVALLFRAGADEVLNVLDGCAEEGRARIDALLRRSRRDLSAQPTTRLPGGVAIEEEIARRIAAHEPFAACYADLDHFKEYNDRYGYHEGDRVIRMVARVLRDVATGVAGDRAFVGHVGGDDFMLVLPADSAQPVCHLALEVFDVLAPLQYSEADRRAGYYFGKDRRGQLHRVPLMTLSIGGTSTDLRDFRSVGEVSRLASEMKSFAKATAGSTFAVDRRSDSSSSEGAVPILRRHP